MLRKLCAALMLMLAGCPFTAPFQTWGSSDSRINGTRTPIVDARHHATSHIDDAGSLIGPLEQKHGQLRLIHVAAVTLCTVTASVRTILPPAAACVDSIRQTGPTTLVTILRV